MIVLQNIVVATTADLLNSTRLQSVDRDGMMIIELIANLADATNQFTVTLQLPSGDTPVNAQLVSGVNPSLAGVMDRRMHDRYEFPVASGGHMTITFTETGTAILFYRVTFI